MEEEDLNLESLCDKHRKMLVKLQNFQLDQLGLWTSKWLGKMINKTNKKLLCFITFEFDQFESGCYKYVLI